MSLKEWIRNRIAEVNKVEATSDEHSGYLAGIKSTLGELLSVIDYSGEIDSLKPKEDK